jgi:hypothetical protein
MTSLQLDLVFVVMLLCSSRRSFLEVLVFAVRTVHGAVEVLAAGTNSCKTETLGTLTRRSGCTVPCPIGVLDVCCRTGARNIAGAKAAPRRLHREHKEGVEGKALCLAWNRLSGRDPVEAKLQARQLNFLAPWLGTSARRLFSARAAYRPIRFQQPRHARTDAFALRAQTKPHRHAHFKPPLSLFDTATDFRTMVRLLAFASLLVLAVVSLSPATASIPDPMTVVAAATNVAVETGSNAIDVVTDAAKRNTNDASQVLKKA